MPVTSVGRISGPSDTARIMVLPGKIVALQGEGQRHADCGSDHRSHRRQLEAEQQRLRPLRMRRLHPTIASRSPRGGKNERLVALNETASVIRIGAMMNT